MKNIVLIGFMGTGKTLVGKKLARRLKMDFVDLDEVIEKENKMKISEIFERYGEKYFRQLETKAVKKISDMNNHVISTGGGVVLKSENVKNLKKNGVIVCLKASPEIILKRIEKEKNRPLLEVKDREKKIKELLKFREVCYKKVADYMIDSSGSVNNVVKKILTKELK
jgi:shikimate kinase